MPREVLTLCCVLLSFTASASAEWRFTAESFRYPVPTNPVSLAVADFNDDGAPDVATALATGNIALLTNNGSGALALASIVNVPRLLKVLAQDLNNDGRPDLIGVLAGFGAAFVTLTNGGGVFSVAATTSTIGGGIAPNGLTTGDIDGDGWAEIITVNGGPVSIFTNNHAAAFSHKTNFYTGGFYPANAAAADFDENGSIDVMVTHYEYSAVLMLNNGAGTLSAARNVEGAVGGVTPRAVDMNNDGRVDCLFDERLYTNAGSGWLLFANAVAPAGRFRTVADFNTDAWPEVVAHSGARLDISTNNHAHVFSTVSRPSVQGDPAEVAAADLNGDGRLDLVSVASSGQSVEVVLYYPRTPLWINRVAPGIVQVSWPWTDPLSRLHSTTNVATTVSSWLSRDAGTTTNTTARLLEFSPVPGERAEFFLLSED